MRVPFRVLSRVLLRAPLLRVRALARGAEALLAHPLGRGALELASRELAAALRRRSADERTTAARARRAQDERTDAAIARYARRAAFRPTPSGWLAGVALGEVAERTAIATGAPVAHLRPAWARLDAAARGVLDDAAVRRHVRLRLAPSLLIGGGQAAWLALQADGVVIREVEIDEVLGALIAVASARGPVPWSRARRLVARAAHPERGRPPADEDVDSFLLRLIDDGFLEADVTPPLVGPPPDVWLARRLRELHKLSGGRAVGRAAAAAGAVLGPPHGVESAASEASAALARASAACRRRDVTAAATALAGLPGAAEPHLHGTLKFTAPAAAVDRAALERAAALAPFLFRLQEAMAAPLAERALDPALREKLLACAEIFGAGAFEVEALGVGGYGEPLADNEASERATVPAPDTRLLARLVDEIAAAAAAGRWEIRLDRERLEAFLPAIEPLPSFELFLVPARASRAAPPGTNWVLGLHAPAGATWGRFVEVLGPAARTTLRELAAAEASAHEGTSFLDVSYAPSRRLADLAAHSPIRGAALAIVGWPDGPAVTPASLELAIDGARPRPFDLRARSGGPVAPSPLHRVRSTTVPPGLYRLLAGWSLARQHAPWAFTWGALGGLARLPRVVVDGFVVAPASWRIPPARELRKPAALARWRQELGVPAEVQVGHGDELMHVDLRAPGAVEDLARDASARAHEIWPPLARLADRNGRRVEVVALVVAEPDDEEDSARETAALATRTARRVSPPAREPPPRDWVTFKIYGSPERQDDVLAGAVAPAVAAGRARGEIRGWFFQRYIEGPGARPHLRVRVRATAPARAPLWRRRLQAALAAARTDGALTLVETSEYLRETARYGGPAAVAAAESLFEHASDLVIDMLAVEAAAYEPPAADRVELAVRAWDVVSRGLGLSRSKRQALARRKREAHEMAGDYSVLGDFDAAGAPRETLAREATTAADAISAVRDERRRRGRRLREILAGRERDAFTPPLATYAQRVAQTARHLLPATRAKLQDVLPALLHVDAVRLLGPHPSLEALAAYLWERTLQAPDR